MSRIECPNMKSSVQWLLLFYQLCSSLTLRLCFFPSRPHTLFPTHCEVVHLGDNCFALLYHLYLQAHASSGPLSECLPREVQLLGSSLYQGVFRGCMA